MFRSHLCLVLPSGLFPFEFFVSHPSGTCCRRWTADWNFFLFKSYSICRIKEKMQIAICNPPGSGVILRACFTDSVMISCNYFAKNNREILLFVSSRIYVRWVWNTLHESLSLIRVSRRSALVVALKWLDEAVAVISLNRPPCCYHIFVSIGVLW
jgi:hypothetical protein